jgi:lipopolysaccharide export system permease protein
MRLIQRYLFRQLLSHTVLATAALTGVAVLTASLSALDILVNDRQSPLIFTEITLLATPQIVAMILPLAVCVAGLVGLNRLHTEQEIVICFAGGMSRWRVAAPAIRLATFIAILNLIINLWIQPLCFREMRHVLEGVKADIATTMIRPGEFTHPGPGLTVFAQSMDENGGIKNLFIDKDNGHGGSTTDMAA